MTFNRDSVLKTCVAVFVSFFLLTLSNGYAEKQIEEVRIADGKGDWGYPNPYRHYPRGPGYIRMSWVFDSLVWKDDKGYIPALASDWTFNEESMTYVFDLNPRAKWHDGKALTASDVVFTIQYMKRHPYSWIDIHRIAGARILTRHKLAVTLKKPYAPFLAEIGGTMPILPEHIWKNIENPKTFDGPAAYIGSGPYVFKDYNRVKKTYLYESFDGYYLGKPKVHKLIYVKSGNPLMSLSTNKASLANIQPDMVKYLRPKGFTILYDKSAFAKKLMINHRKAPFDDVRFRRALACFINRRELIEKAHRGYGKIASCGLLSVDHSMYNPDTPSYPFKPKEGHKLMASLGYEKNGQGYYAKNGALLKIELLAARISVAGNSLDDRDGEILKKQLEAAGIKTTFYHLELATVDAKVKNWDFQLVVSGHGGLMGDPKLLNELISSKYGAGSSNCARFDTNDCLNRLLDQQMEIMDYEERKKAVFEIQAMHARLLPSLPLYYPEVISAYNPLAGVHWYYTKDGISKGIPVVENKMALVK